MEWFVVALVVAALVLVLLVGYALTAKRHGGDAIPGHFEFDRYKEGELAERGVYDKTKWR